MSHCYCDPHKHSKHNKYVDYKKIRIKALLHGHNEVPPTNSHGEGKLAAYLICNGKNNYTLDYTLTCSCLDHSVISAHFHDGTKGSNGPILKEISVNNQGNAAGYWNDITNENATKLKQAGIYVNVHTNEYPNGEIRGQTYEK
jgi:hypothetical protein